MPPQAAPIKTEKRLRSGALPNVLTTPRSFRPAKQPKDFALRLGSEFKRAETKLREKHAAESGWKQDVSNRPLSRSDLAGVPTERSVFRVSFVRAAYGATGVKQNPGESFSAPGDSA
ncbi:hypothetical protein [Desulfitobacterium hafniense]|uniref:hypothetical protein n=1 Tax=Desulfitobacterium hafniense TaxID=49338 RepID=UPI001AEBB4A9|nr:hypothetical protein [Desulfitobacterium hafniense]